MDRQKTEQEKRENIKITWMGTATFLLEAAGERILFDPFVPIKGGENPGCIDDFLKEKQYDLKEEVAVPSFWRRERAPCSAQPSPPARWNNLRMRQTG